MTICIRNALLLTCEPDMPVIDPGHVLIRDGLILAAGAGSGPDDALIETIDADGDIVMPGMVNPHAHLPMTLFRGLGEDVDDRLFRYVLPMERKFVSPRMVRVGTALAAWESIRAGVTTIADMYYHEIEVASVLDAAGLRGIVGQTIADFDPPDHRTVDEGFARVEQLVEAFGGHARILPSIAPHAPYSTGVSVLERVAQWASDNHDIPVQIHLAEMDSEMDWARQKYGCSPVDVVRQAGLLSKGLIAAHCLHVGDSDMLHMANAGVGVAHNARSNAKAGRGIAPVEALRRNGIPVGIATDGPMSGNTLDLFAQFGAVSMFAKLRGRSRKPMPAREVIRMATLEGAEVLGMNRAIGSIAPGKAADLIRVSLASPRLQPVYDPYATLVFAATPEDVVDVMVAGRWLMRDRTVLTLERDRVLRDAGQIAQEFRAEMTRIDHRA
ncbi:MAG: amidohydrolase [Rhodobacteraceae bacterium]|nr:amidohydrolase [Paracoccaceae bacterium]